MEIKLSKYAGFCDGVKRAFDMVMGLDLKKAKRPVFILGSLVHNPEVNKKIEEKGIKEIDREKLFGAKPGEIGTVIITAHGTGPDIFEAAEERGMEVFDTTCPKVIKVQKLAKAYSKRKYKIVIVGDKDHKEVKGINDWSGENAFIVSRKEDLEKINFDPDEKLAVLSQTTQNEDFFLEIGYQINKKYKNAEIISTTCNTTHERQTEVKHLAEENDVMIIIGSKTSANSRRLFEISKSLNSRSYFIETATDLDPKWLKGISKVGVTAGASTPNWIISEVMKKIGKS